MPFGKPLGVAGRAVVLDSPAPLFAEEFRKIPANPYGVNDPRSVRQLTPQFDAGEFTNLLVVIQPSRAGGYDVADGGCLELETVQRQRATTADSAPLTGQESGSALHHLWGYGPNYPPETVVRLGIPIDYPYISLHGRYFDAAGNIDGGEKFLSLNVWGTNRPAIANPTNEDRILLRVEQQLLVGETRDYRLPTYGGPAFIGQWFSNFADTQFTGFTLHATSPGNPLPAIGNERWLGYRTKGNDHVQPQEVVLSPYRNYLRIIGPPASAAYVTFNLYARHR